MEILRNIDIEIAAFCLAGLVLVQLALELRRLYLDSQETPPRVIRLERAGEEAEAREANPGSAAKRWV